MNHKTYKQLEFEPYVEHGYHAPHKQPLTKEMFQEEAQDLAEALITASQELNIQESCLYISRETI